MNDIFPVDRYPPRILLRSFCFRILLNIKRNIMLDACLCQHLLIYLVCCVSFCHVWYLPVVHCLMEKVTYKKKKICLMKKADCGTFLLSHICGTNLGTRYYHLHQPRIQLVPIGGMCPHWNFVFRSLFFFILTTSFKSNSYF